MPHLAWKNVLYVKNKIYQIEGGRNKDLKIGSRCMNSWWAVTIHGVKIYKLSRKLVKLKRDQILFLVGPNEYHVEKLGRRAFKKRGDSIRGRTIIG